MRKRRRGDFDNLPGHGKPLRLEEINPFEGSKHLVHKILKDHSFAPQWIELNKEIHRELETARRRLADSYQRCGAVPAAWQRAVDRFAEQMAELNAKIDLYNLKAPAMQFQRRRVILEDEIRRVKQGQGATADD